MDTVTHKILTAIADAEDTNPENLGIILHKWIDADAVGQLVNHSSSSWELQFEIPDYTVTITGDGIVHVDEEQGRKVIAN